MGYKHYIISEELLDKSIINNPGIKASEMDIKPITEEEYNSLI